MRSSTTSCEHSRLSAFNRYAILSYFYFWYSCESCIIQLRARRIWRDDDFMISWNESEKLRIEDSSDISVSAWTLQQWSANTDCVSSIVLREISSRCIERDYSFLQSLRDSLINCSIKNIDFCAKSTERIELKWCDSNILIQKVFVTSRRCDFRFSSSCLFETHALVKRSIQRTVEYYWLIEHKSTANDWSVCSALW